jgi:hypothetical protein
MQMTAGMARIMATSQRPRLPVAKQRDNAIFRKSLRLKLIKKLPHYKASSTADKP